MLRIRNKHPGSDFFPSQIPDSHQRILSTGTYFFNPKTWFLSFRKYYSDCSSRIRILTFCPSQIPDPEVKKAPDPGSGSAALKTLFQHIVSDPDPHFFRLGGSFERLSKEPPLRPLFSLEFVSYEKVPFQPLFKNIREQPAFQKGDFSVTLYRPPEKIF